jgi:hypothetical protein
MLSGFIDINNDNNISYDFTNGLVGSERTKSINFLKGALENL